MNLLTGELRERLRLVATNPMRIAGLQGIYGDPCGIELIPITVSEALCLNKDPIVLIDSGSVKPLFEVIARVRTSCPRARLVVIGTDADDTYIECVIAAGAKGFVSAIASPEEFRTALDNVRDGSIWAPRRVLSRIIGKQHGERGGTSRQILPKVQLTPRETEVLRHLLGGKANREIGARLGIDPGTVKGHLQRIMRKAGVVNRVELTMYALHCQPEPAPALLSLHSGD